MVKEILYIHYDIILFAWKNIFDIERNIGGV